MNGALPADLGMPWPLALAAVGSTCAALAWRPAWVWVYIVAAAICVGVDRMLASATPVALVALQDALFVLMYTSIFSALTMVTLGAGRRLDRAALAAREQTARAAVLQADRPTNRAMKVVVTGGRVHVEVRDDGPGFDRELVPASRMG